MTRFVHLDHADGFGVWVNAALAVGLRWAIPPAAADLPPGTRWCSLHFAEGKPIVVRHSPEDTAFRLETGLPQAVGV